MTETPYQIFSKNEYKIAELTFKRYNDKQEPFLGTIISDLFSCNDENGKKFFLIKIAKYINDNDREPFIIVDMGFKLHYIVIDKQDLEQIPSRNIVVLKPEKELYYFGIIYSSYKRLIKLNEKQLNKNKEISNKTNTETEKQVFHIDVGDMDTEQVNDVIKSVKPVIELSKSVNDINYQHNVEGNDIIIKLAEISQTNPEHLSHEAIKRLGKFVIDRK